ncbi:unnamed protein product [Musa acuminata subsp. malaccensis]|uniref:Mitochondrial pyruvate carrier n=1 Tax=Musa acuminata subsp. malaccensis TaxID=214687 RepID=A0A804L2K4_MUSAM|nr:PREDICTED: mitochondrial pyruvate carrier 4-like isoform X1 [Musa acuminata subsp. malaccensis]XP_009381934.1 PREDICTED: mitochondrial pyruvate carrier 4-like isoform X1 [Musa acuminata subsp. malaccensis]CAG1863104.1 unnamed protein product [Musa acuminata subsp. malaccensis]
MAASKIQALWNHPAGPKTIHFWAPTFKWGISIANVADFSKPPEKISYPQQVGVYILLSICGNKCLFNFSSIFFAKRDCHCLMLAAVTCTGLIWSRYSTVITPKNWNLFSVNVVMAGTGIYQLARKTRHDHFSEVQVPGKE